MGQNEQLWEERKRIAFSYVRKLVLFGVACCGFLALNWLIEQKKTFDDHKQKSWEVDADVALIVGKATGAEACVDPDATRSFATREELIAAMQEKAEACVWEEFRTAAEDVHPKMADLTQERLENYTGYANFLAKEAAFAGARARAASQKVKADLMSRKLEPKMNYGEQAGQEGVFDRAEAFIQRTLDEEGGQHVIYQILWYASLVLGVLASSMLFIMILTALPITDSETPWKEKVIKILDHAPAATNRAIAVPLLAAVLGGGTLVGTVIETEAGGQARTPYETSKPSDAQTPAAVTGRSPVAYRAGDVYNDRRSWGGLTLEFPASGLTEISDDLAAIRRKAVSLAAQTEATRKEVVAAIEKASLKIDHIGVATQNAERRLVHVERTVDATQEIADGIAYGVANLNSRVADLQQGMVQQAERMAMFAGEVTRRQTSQKETLGKSFAQSAERDPRNPFVRTFGWTLFQVGPAVHTVMSARLENMKSSSTTETETLLSALKFMRDYDPPLNRWDFERRLRAKLKALGLTRDRIDLLMETHLPSLLRTCALPR